MRILILSQPLDPFTHHEFRINHHVDLLAVVPRLGVLVAVALDADVVVDDHQLDMTGALFEFVVNRADLIFGHIRIDVQVVAVFGAKGVVERVGDHFVVAALAGEEFAGVVVAEAVVVGDLDAALAGGHNFGEEGFGVEVGGLDEDGFGRVAEGRGKGLVLRCVQTVFVGGSPGLAADHGDGEWLVAGDRDERGHGVGGLDLWGAAFRVGLDGGVEETGDAADSCLAFARVQSRHGAQDLRLDVWVIMGVCGGVLREGRLRPLLGDIPQIVCPFGDCRSPEKRQCFLPTDTKHGDSRLIDWSQFAILVQGRLLVRLECRQGTISRWSIKQWERGLKGIVPRYHSNLVEGIDDGALELYHHFHVVDVLDVVALHNGDTPVDYHVLGMERPEYGFMEIHHFNVDIREFFRVRYADFALGICKLLGFDREMVVD